MTRERAKQIERLFREYEHNKKELAQDYNVPVPSGVCYDKICVQSDRFTNWTEEKYVKYAADREELCKKIFIVEETLFWFQLEGHGRERFIQKFFIDGETWVKSQMECCISEGTIVYWRRDVIEKAEAIGKIIGFFE